jgi:hypothetical protein
MLTEKGKRVGRPRNPQPPRSPEPHERPEYAARLQVILDAVEIDDIPKDVRLYLQKILQRCDRLRSFDPQRFIARGEEEVTLLLRTVFESSNGAAPLTLPILMAVSNCMRPVWVDRGLAWIEAFDHIDLATLYATLIELGLSDQIDRALFKKLEDILGPPVVSAPPPQKTPPSRRAIVRPKDISERTWNEVMALRKSKRPTGARRPMDTISVLTVA